MTADVVHLDQHQTAIRIARQRHPAGKALIVDGAPHIDDPAAVLTQLARAWDRMLRDLTAGPGALTEASGDAALHVLLCALVHRHARAALVLTWPQVRYAVRHLDDVMDGDAASDCFSYAEAVGRADAELAWQLYPLVHGLPPRDACPDCVRLNASVNPWQTRLGCTDHGTR